MSRRKWAAIALVSTGAAVLIGRRLVRRPPPALVVAAAVVAASSASWWNPISWVSGVGDIASNVVSDIKRWAIHAIDSAIKVYDSALSPIINDLDTGLSWVSAGLHVAEQAAGRLLGRVNQLITKDLPDLGRWAISQAVAVASSLISDVSSALDYVSKALSFAISSVTNGLADLAANVVAPVVSWVEHAGHWALTLISGWWNDVWSSTVGPAIAAVRWLADNVPGWIDWLTSEAYPWIKAVIKAGEWIVWLGEHTFVDLAKLTGELIDGMGPDRFDQWVKAAPQQADNVEKWLHDLLG